MRHSEEPPRLYGRVRTLFPVFDVVDDGKKLGRVVTAQGASQPYSKYRSVGPSEIREPSDPITFAVPVDLFADYVAAKEAYEKAAQRAAGYEAKIAEYEARAIEAERRELAAKHEIEAARRARLTWAEVGVAAPAVPDPMFEDGDEDVAF